ncbi:uncharacterized protein LOC133524588 isoform X2 [Cydia pomonella]|uniref:uncharacterized protein LOC133524588 isoform X2 n=1 Tax=Cydia pomonella TaxID=82600 RepID=UPI002ADE5005|nr:uncharacterized protein LOC133524588 isoform X2 [Cydia pomonella]
MNDPWDVKSRQAGQYVSCMKINGVPLLPPLLSKECRKEMQYYKLLAKEVEKRIAELKAYVGDSDEDSAQDNTDATEMPQEYEQPHEPVQEILQVFDSNITTFREEKLEESLSASTNTTNTNSSDLCNSVSSSNASYSLPKFSVNSIQNGISNSIKAKCNNSQHTPQPIEPPERDCNATPTKITKVEKLTEDELSFDGKKPEREIVDLLRVEFDISKVEPLLSGAFPDMTMTDGPASLGSKSFTGSLNNIHSESVKDAATLVRQSSYTVLNPSPLLLAHLKVQSLSTGVEVTSISMSESLSNLTSPKKRRSWDLESAKMKWSSMAHELKQKTAQTKPSATKDLSKSTVKKPQQTPPRSKSVAEKPRRASMPGKAPKSEPIQNQKPKNSIQSPYANTNSTNVKEPKPTIQPSPKKLISECEDPAAKVKELYERIQNQQLLQMANLVEKQKREQMLLQQVFDEQNSILYRQLKTICPKSPVEAKAAWADKVDRGPVSLSQLINHKSPDSLTSTLTDTHNNLNKCAEVLKKSKDITGSIKKQNHPGSPTDGSRTRTHSPKRTKTSRKLSYDTSSSDREFEPILTDRTNDTLVGLNVTFTSDSDEPTFMEKQPSTHSAVRSVETSVKVPARRPVQARLPPTPEQLAAASTIVAHAKGYLVRRLLRTERVQATVQTIKDALLCALQMHQDRAGIRGADVDLHRRLIQQITAACYSLHDTFVASTPAERCALIAADRERRRQKPARPFRTDVMSQSHSGAFPARAPHSSSHSMTQSHYGNAH